MELTARLKNIKDRLFNEEYHTPKTWHFKDVNILEQNEDLKSEPLVVRKAIAMDYICTHLPAVIKRDELIVANPNMNSVGWGTIMPIYYTQEEGEKAKEHELNEASVWGHHPPHWDKIINTGIIGVKKEIHEAIERELRQTEPRQSVLEEYRAMIISLDGVIKFGQRYSAAALEASLKEKNPVRRNELYEIYKVCSHVPLHPARNLLEATQSYWFAYCIVNSGGEYVPLGRGDQFLYPYFVKDLEEHVITRERAVDIIGSFLAKCNEKILLDTKKAENHYNFGLFSQGVVPDESVAKSITGGYDQRALVWRDNEDIDSESNFNYGQSGNDWLMNFMVGGLLPDGTDATNELSYLFVDLIHDMDLLMPTLGARVHKYTPDPFLRKLAEVLRYGQGEPMIYNDESIIPGFVDLGIPIEDARDYSNDGCWETLIPGKSYFSYAHIENLQCLEWVLFNGKSMLRDQQEGLETGNPTQFKTWDDFYYAYLRQMNARIDFQCHRRLENLGLSFMIAPDPLISSFTDDCVQKGRDQAQDGARYIFHQLLITGFANTIDGLAAIKKLVYEEERFSIQVLLNAIKNDWEGFENIRSIIQNDVPKFGNDADYVDDIGIRLMKDFEDRVQEWRTKQNKILFTVGIGTFENYAVLGRGICATPDGRFSKEAIAPNFSPVPGADITGPTAAIKSVTKPELLRYYSGCPLDLAINANEFEGDAGIERLKGLIKSFCDLGGNILTITSSSIDDFLDAKVNPEQHQNLRVRMGGLSAYFVAMAPAQQDNIIKRFSKGSG